MQTQNIPTKVNGTRVVQLSRVIVCTTEVPSLTQMKTI
jgi:hypothetical protein